jgi:4a-hydroxytetrahydrobiopterin dehydratase
MKPLFHNLQIASYLKVDPMANLAQEHCVSINASSLRLDEAEAGNLLAELNGWKIINKNNELMLEKSFKFADFKQALAFTNQLGQLAEVENHHPALLTEWGLVTASWWTHRIKGLHRNDFIMAAKTEAVYSKNL